MAPATDDFGSDGVSANPGTNKLHQAAARDGSPDSKCPICLDSFENAACLNHCYHRFCFRCVQKWSKIKAECPLCKQPLRSIIHSLQSDGDFKEYIVRPSESGSFGHPDGRRFRHRPSLAREQHRSVFAPSYEEGSRSDSSIIAISPDEADSQEPEHRVFPTGIAQAPWADDTPGPSYSSASELMSALSAALDTSESSEDEAPADAPESPMPLSASVETNGDSDGSSDNCVIVAYVKPLAERAPELVELSSDSEGSVDDAKSEDVSKVLPSQSHSFGDTNASGNASPCSLGSRDGRSSYKDNMSLSSEMQSKRHERDKATTREVYYQELATKLCYKALLQSSAAERGEDGGDGDGGNKLSKRKKSESYSQPSHSREHHGTKSKRKHHSMEKQERRRDSSRHKRKRDNKKSRDESLSRKSQTLSLSREGLVSRDLSRSRSRSNEHQRRRSRSKDSDYYPRDNYQSRYRWEHSMYGPNAARDGYKYRRQTQARAPYSRQSTGTDYSMQSFFEWTDSRNPSGSRYCYHERSSSRSRSSRSRSRSGGRSRTPPMGAERMCPEKPSGKRQDKTRHLESAHRSSEEASSTKAGNALQSPLLKYKDSYKRKDSFLDVLDPESHPKKRRRTPRSPSVEIIYEGKATGARHHERKRKRGKRSHKIHTGSTFSSPVVITMDRDKEPETQGNTAYDSSCSWSPLVPEREGESPSSLFENQDCTYGRGNEVESMDQDSHVAATVGVSQDEILDPNGLACAVSADQSFDTGNQPGIVEEEPLNRLPAARTSLIFRLLKKLMEYSCRRHSPDQKV